MVKAMPITITTAIIPPTMYTSFGVAKPVVSDVGCVGVPVGSLA